ncbi:hypothetical protein H1R20_g9811, partial [Candolleomyces eurysporus]
MTTRDSTEAERLKLLGTELYKKGDYQGAYDKLSEAIEKDPENAILYQNRGAVSMKKHEYLDAVWDAKKATSLDPKYAKAWARLGAAAQALGTWQECIYAWQQALDCLPKNNLTEDQKGDRKQWRTSLKKSLADQVKVESTVNTVSILDIQSGTMPWDVAWALRNSRMAERRASSVLILANAYTSFKEGMNYYKEAKFERDAQGREHYSGTPAVIRHLSEAVLVDPRVFHVTDGEFFEKIIKIASIEDEAAKGWLNTGGPAIIKKAVLQRLEKDGFDAVRPSLTTTVR